MSVRQNWEWTAMIFEMLARAVHGETSPKQLMGPLGIAEVSGRSAADGLGGAVRADGDAQPEPRLLNLLPIPMLDGGHIFIMPSRAWRVATSACASRSGC